MSILHFILTIFVVIIWGLNFIFLKLALDEMTPFLLCALRFFLASVPAIFFIKPPAVPFRIIALYGIITFALQFSLLFTSMKMGMPPGMASLLLQVQVFFSLFFASILLKEFPTPMQILGAIISFSGIALLAMHFDNNISILSFLLILASAATWGLGNLITKKTKKINMIALVVWASFIATFPMVILSLLIDGVPSIVNSYQHLTSVGIISLLYIVFASTWFGYGVWNWLLSQYPVSIVTPFTLLVPIVGMLSAVVILNEPLQDWKIIAGGLVLSGLIINLFGSRIYNKLRYRRKPIIDKEINEC